MIPSTSPIEKKHSLTPHPVISDSEQPCRRSKTDFLFYLFLDKNNKFYCKYSRSYAGFCLILQVVLSVVSGPAAQVWRVCRRTQDSLPHLQLVSVSWCRSTQTNTTSNNTQHILGVSRAEFYLGFLVSPSSDIIWIYRLLKVKRLKGE